MAPWYPKAQIASITRMIPAMISTTAENVSQPERPISSTLLRSLPYKFTGAPCKSKAMIAVVT